MTEHHAISRRAFTLGLGLAALSPLASLPETAALGIGPRAAFADDAATASVSLNNFVIRLRPAGYFRTASVNEDGNVIGNVCHLFNDGTSSKLILENVTTKNDDTNWYAIRTLLNFEEHKKTGYSIWSVDGDSDKDGKVIHVWSGEHDGKPSRSFAFERQSNGTYIIRDRTVEKETEKKDIKYLAIESNGEDQDNNKICHKSKSKSIPWELELIGYDMKKNDATVSSLDWITYSSYVDGPCWMKYVDDNKFLDELSIPGTHDSGTCSVDNDTEPQSSQVKCQQDYIPTQLLEGIRYFDIRLGKGDDPGIDHGIFYLLKKDGNYLHLSDVIGYFKTFLNETPSEALIMLASRGNDEATDESITTAFAKVMADNPNLFYTSSHVPTLGEVRGKIVLLRRFGLAGNSVSGHTWGLDLTQWDDKIKAHSGQSMCLVQDARGFEAIGETGNEEPYCTKVYAQDKYKLTGTDKLSWVDNALKETTGRTCNKVDVVDDAGAEVQVQERCWSINYTSCTGLSHGGNPFTSARVVNEHLYKSPYINPSGTEDTKSDYLKHIGIIASDFVDAALARSIYQRNYNYDTKHTQSASCCLPTRMRMTYGDSLSDASLQDGKTVGEGHFRLVDSSNVLNVAASGHAFTIEYVDVDALGNETVTGLQGSVPIDIDPRALTPHFEGLEGLKAGEDVRTKVAALLEGKLENDACTAQLEFVHDADGAPGTAMVEGEAFTAGTYWVRANGLLGDAAQNYKLANDGAASFTVAASGSAGGTGSGTGSNAGSADKNGKGNKGKNSGGKLADTGDGSGIAAGLAAAAVATTVAGAAMLANDRENAGDGSE
ncbi:phosphatidylinositol-specific phospholipase C [Collinsella aerofaciens]|uniref:phosphatidylinositol-specific phospholipase C n=1 Tax=Collinsella aerofaciens TaxID=74426 RepID=UPI00189BFF05|nr:phosphatidylinositol-specific phospholipase C [Collinsella aerofaciens]MDB1920390.1 phosphatidylinositol-specific phospholipase C [Collinsella aerofaciens]